MPLDRSTVQRGIALGSLRSVRESRGLSQEELAQRAGITRATIVNLEHGATRARPSSASQIAAALGISIDVLTGNAPLPTPKNEAQGVLSDYLEAAMHHAVFRRVGGEPERVYAAIPGIAGLWARGAGREEAERDLREALEWFVLSAVFDHRPLPAFDDASLEIEEERPDGIVTVYPVASSSHESLLEGLSDEASAG